MRAIAYARYSTDRQTEASTADQLRVCREFAAARGWTIEAEHTDEGISGAAFGNRPGVQSALASLAAGDVLLVADTTRLSRSQELAPLIDRLRFRGVRVIGVLDGFDSTSAQARMQAGLSGLMSDELRANIRVRTHSALQMRAKAGTATGGKAYGYDSSGRVIEGEALILREAFARAAVGESMRSIASDFNARGVASPGSSWNRGERRRDGRWLVSALHAILRNDRYIGRVTWNRSIWVKDPDTGKRVRRERPESEWVVREGEAIIEPAIWARVQAYASERRDTYGSPVGSKPKYLLSGLLTCSQCGGRMIATGKGGAWYYCGTRHHGGPAACSMATGVRRDVAEQLILEPVRAALLSPEAVTKAVGLIMGFFREERTSTDGESDPAVAAIDAELAELETLISERPALSITLREAAEGLRTRRLAAARAAWRRAASVHIPESEVAVNAYRAAVQDLSDVLAGPSGIEARQAVRELLGGDVPCWPADGHLVAVVGISPVPLFQRAGLISQIGSGGVLWSGDIPLKRFHAR